MMTVSRTDIDEPGGVSARPVSDIVTYLAGDEPLTKRRLGRYAEWKDDLRLAAKFCAANGLSLELVEIRHQVAKIRGDDVCLVIYPHRTTSFNYHLRVRNENSKNRARALEIIDQMDEAAGPNCTFRRHI